MFGEEQRREGNRPIGSSGLPLGRPSARLFAPFRRRRVGPDGEVVLCRGAPASIVQLKVGLSAVVDAVNPFESMRSEYRELALDQQAQCVHAYTVCTDQDLHRRRVEARRAEGNPVDWAEVERQTSFYEVPQDADVIIDATNPLDSNVAEVLAHIRSRQPR